MNLNTNQLKHLNDYQRLTASKDGVDRDRHQMWLLSCNQDSYDYEQNLMSFIVDHPYGIDSNGRYIANIQGFIRSLYTVGTIGKLRCIQSPPCVTAIFTKVAEGRRMIADGTQSEFQISNIKPQYGHGGFNAYHWLIMRPLQGYSNQVRNPLKYYGIDSKYPAKEQIKKLLKIRTIALLFVLADLAWSHELIYVKLVKLLITKYSKNLASFNYAKKIMIDIFKLYLLIQRYEDLPHSPTKLQDKFLLQQVEELMKRDGGFRSFIFRIVLIDQINCSHVGRDLFNTNEHVSYFAGAYNYRIRSQQAIKYYGDKKLRAI